MLILIDKLQKNSGTKNKMYRISFRLNPHLNNEDTNTFRVDLIAKKLGGGGHKGASSVKIKNLDNAYSKIKEWLHKFGIDYLVQTLS